MGPDPDRGHPNNAHPIHLRFAGTLLGFEQGFIRLRASLDTAGLCPSVRARYNLELVFEEIVGNALRYGAPQGLELRVDVHLRREGEHFVMTLEDDGIPFDPSAATVTTGARTLDGTSEGGFGLIIVRHAASAMHYERTLDGRNRLTVMLPALD